MRFYNAADTIQSKTILTLTDVSERFAPPILCDRIENGFWFLQSEHEAVIVDSRLGEQCAVAAIVLKSVGENFHKHLLEKLRIHMQHHILSLHLPINFSFFVWKFTLDFGAHIRQKLRSSIGNHIRCNL